MLFWEVSFSYLPPWSFGSYSCAVSQLTSRAWVSSIHWSPFLSSWGFFIRLSWWLGSVVGLFLWALGFCLISVWCLRTRPFFVYCLRHHDFWINRSFGRFSCWIQSIVFCFTKPCLICFLPRVRWIHESLLSMCINIWSHPLSKLTQIASKFMATASYQEQQAWNQAIRTIFELLTLYLWWDMLTSFWFTPLCFQSYMFGRAIRA